MDPGTVLFASVICLSIVALRYIKARHVERMRYFDRLDENDLVEYPSIKNKGSYLKTGIILCGIALGFFVGFLMGELVFSNSHGNHNPVPYFFTVPFFTGASLIAYYLLLGRDDIL